MVFGLKKPSEYSDGQKGENYVSFKLPRIKKDKPIFIRIDRKDFLTQNLWILDELRHLLTHADERYESR